MQVLRVCNGLFYIFFFHFHVDFQLNLFSFCLPLITEILDIKAVDIAQTSTNEHTQKP